MAGIRRRGKTLVLKRQLNLLWIWQTEKEGCILCVGTGTGKGDNRAGVRGWCLREEMQERPECGFSCFCK